MSNNKDIPSVPNPQSHSAHEPHARFRGAPHSGRRFTVTVAVTIALAVMALAGIAMAIAWGSRDHHETALFGLAAPGPSRRALPQPKGSKQSGAKTGESKSTVESQSPSSSDDDKPSETQSGRGSDERSSSTPIVTAADVRVRASQLSHSMSAITGTSVAGIDGSVYDLLTNGGESDSPTYANAEAALTNLLKQDVQYPDGASSQQCAQELNALNTAYTNWETAFWKAANDAFDTTADAAYQAALQLTANQSQYCSELTAVVSRRPQKGSSRQSFEQQTSWYDRLMNQWQDCEARAAR